MSMDSHYNPVQYAQMLIDEIERSGLFDQEPISKDRFHQHLLNKAINNALQTGEYLLNEMEMLDCYELTVRDYIDTCIADALQDELIEITGIDENGEMTYGVSEKGKEFAERFEKDNGVHVVVSKFEHLGDYGPMSLN